MSQLAVNQLIKGQKGLYQVIRSLTQTVYHAKVEATDISVVLKIRPDHPKLFLNEAKTYQYKCITKSPYIRSLREYINNGDGHCLVLEWMDNTLWETKKESTQVKAQVFTTVAKSCLEALAVFQDMDGTGQYIHADFNPNNVLVSDFCSPTPVVKLADLGWTTCVDDKEDCTIQLQGDAIRAPEIWKGASPTPACDIWSLGVSLAHWMSSRILFGVGGCNIETNHPKEVTKAGWCIAKLHKMRGAELEGPIEDKYVMEWAIADKLLSQSQIQTLTISDALKQVQVPPECIAFIEHLLVVDPKKRPSVAEALAHPMFGKFRCSQQV